jgi:hypothetical protein
MATKITLNLKAISTYLLIGLLVILAFSLYSLLQVQQQLQEIKPPAPPKLAQLTVTAVMPPNCDDCFDASAFAAAVRQSPLTNVSETSVAYDSIEGQKLIQQYKLTRLPAAVVTGEIENVTLQGFTKADDAYVITETPPPYYDLSIGGVVGRVAVTFIVDKGCPKCFDITQFADQLEQAGIVVSSQRALDATETEARGLIEKYAITRIPTMLLSKDALAYDIIQQAWPQVGTEEADGRLVMRNVTPPYKDLAANQVRGLVTITYLVDQSCTSCYNVSLHRAVLEQNFAMQFKEEKTVDVTGLAGERLAAKYRITLVPTFLLDKEAEAYTTLAQAWSQIGTQEEDGTFVFRKVDMLEGATYKDLGTGTVKNATSSS